MASIALHVAGTGTPLPMKILLVIVLAAGLAAAGYFIGREYFNPGRRSPGREQSLRLWCMVGLTILGVIALIGHNLR